jgi:hypothetical protein
MHPFAVTVGHNATAPPRRTEKRLRRAAISPYRASNCRPSTAARFPVPHGGFIPCGRNFIQKPSKLTTIRPAGFPAARMVGPVDGWAMTISVCLSMVPRMGMLEP